MSTYSAKEISSFFIEKASFRHNNDLTNLKLKKILYYAQVEYYRKFHTSLYSDQILAWELGPVIADVYHWLKGFGARTINSQNVLLKYKLIEDDILQFLDDIWEKYSRFSASFLVNKSHDKNGPWHQVFFNKTAKIIDLEMLEFEKIYEEWKK